MGLIEIILTAFLLYSTSLATYLIWHKLVWSDSRYSVTLLKYLYYGQDSGTCKRAHARSYEKGSD